MNISLCCSKTNKNINKNLKQIRYSRVIKFMLKNNFNFEKYFDNMKIQKLSIFPNKLILIEKY